MLSVEQRVSHAVSSYEISGMSQRERAIQGFLDRIVELWIEPDPFEQGYAAYLMRCVESYMGMTDDEFAQRYLHEQE